jgi:acyl transferase domain-containing protein/acyl carrier protein
VSSFGFGGTNAHVVLEEPPAQTAADISAEPTASLLTFSARSREALEATRHSYTEFLLSHPEVWPSDFAFTSNLSRSGLAERAAVVFSDRKELLACLSGGKDSSELGSIRRILFLFSGPVDAFEGAARSLSEASPLFREFLAAAGEGSSFTAESSLAVFPTALARLWTALGARPGAVLYEEATRAAAESFAFTSGINAHCRHEAEVQQGDLLVEIGPNAAGWRSILGKLAEFYRRGGAVEWQALHHGQKRTRLRLPTYPFQRKRYWIPSTAQHRPVPHERRKRTSSPQGLQPGPQPVLQPVLQPGSIEAPKGLLYSRVWNLLYPATGAGLGVGDWLIFADRAGVGALLASHLEAAGNRCSLVLGDSAEELHRLARRPWRGMVHLWSLDLPAADISGRERVSTSVLDLLQLLGASPAESVRTSLWLVTAGAMPVLEGEAPAPSQAAAWGLGQAIAVEYPELDSVLLDLDPSDKSATALLNAMGRADGETMLALRGGNQYAPRMIRQEMGSAAPVRFESNATYLISGGTGGLGLRLAEWLKERGAGAIALLGRTEPREPQTLGRFFRCDLGSLEQTVAVVREIERSMPPLKGVFHLAATLSDGLLADQGAERFYANGIGKAEGSWHLHMATADSPLEHFVLFSSLASLVTRAGQGSYAAANNVLDALAHCRRARGKPALSVNWGPWADTGIAATEYGRLAHQSLASFGVKQLSPAEALTSLEWLISSEATQASVARVDWSRLLKQDRGLAASCQLGGLAEVHDMPEDPETEFMRDLQACPDADRQDWLAGKLAELIAKELRLPDSGSISTEEYFSELGLDSILALDLANQLSGMFGRALPGSLLLTAPTIAALSEHLLH